MPTLLICDSFALIHRAFHAIPPRQNKHGEPNNAVYGLALMLLGAIERERPDFVALAWEQKGQNFRHRLYPQYKAGRATMDGTLAVQIENVRKLLDVLGLPIYECPDFEADDVIATLSRQAVERGLEVKILTGDRDMLQLVSSKIEVLLPGQQFRSTQRVGLPEFICQYGFQPVHFVTYKALMGDKGDNIAGLPGIGEVWASRITRQFATVQAIIDRSAEITSPKIRAVVVENQALLRQALALVTLRADLPIALNLAPVGRPENEAIYSFFKEVGVFDLKFKLDGFLLFPRET